MVRKKRIKLKYKNIFKLLVIILIPIFILTLINKTILSNTIKKESPTKQIEKKVAIKELNELNYNNSVDIKDNIINKLKYSDPSIIITDDKGNVLAHRKENDRREGASTTKIFVGYVALSLLDISKDTIVGSEYSLKECSPYCNNKIDVGRELNVIDAATYVFPDSSNSVATDISIAIGKKYSNATTDVEKEKKGLEIINNYLKENGCTNTHLGNANGLNNTPTDFDNQFDIKTGYPINNSIDGISANDLALITIKAMKNTNFSERINDSNKEGLYYIKAGRGYFCHGVWGINHMNKKYYIIILGINCNLDDKNTLVTELFDWTVKELIK